MNNKTCIKCSKPLDKDDIGAHRKLINRGDSEYFCIPCLADYFNVEEALIRRKVEEFKIAGCLLFM